VNQILQQVDVNEVIGRVDLDAVIDRVDMNAVVQRVDLEALVEQTDLGSVIAKSSSGVASARWHFKDVDQRDTHDPPSSPPQARLNDAHREPTVAPPPPDDRARQATDAAVLGTTFSAEALVAVSGRDEQVVRCAASASAN
jgi:hypothetical protein